MRYLSALLRVMAALALWIGTPPAGVAGDLTALAWPDLAQSSISAAPQGGVQVVIDLSQPVPYRVLTLDNPPRLVADFREVDWRGSDPARLIGTERVHSARAGALWPGWSRLVLDLSGPQVVAAAEMRPERESGRARLVIRTRAGAAAAPAADALPGPPWEAAPGAEPGPAPPREAMRPLRVAIDPGHGGIDPGAEHDGVREADIVLAFARELRETLLRAGVEALLTREADRFVPLEARLDIARRERADVFLSIHADALADGEATGATLYTLSERASDRASELLAQRHERDALLTGVDLTDQDDVIATVLMDLARTETAPRADRLADALVAGLQSHGVRLYKRPRHSADFSVLKSPDIPSVLVELGFLSSAADRENLVSAEWRARTAAAIVDALLAWQAEDAARAALLRR
jgi:N-acetylmuramoyl-L-alanine amidase